MASGLATTALLGCSSKTCPRRSCPSTSSYYTVWFCSVLFCSGRLRPTNRYTTKVSWRTSSEIVEALAKKPHFGRSLASVGTLIPHSDFTLLCLWQPNSWFAFDWYKSRTANSDWIVSLRPHLWSTSPFAFSLAKELTVNSPLA
jgi:hypothetical protein